MTRFVWRNGGNLVRFYEKNLAFLRETDLIIVMNSTAENNSTMTAIEQAIYTRCMKLAEDFAKRFFANRAESSKAKSKSLKPHSMAIDNPWVKLWKAFDKHEIDENEMKVCFILGYLTQYAESICQKYTVQERALTNF